METTQETNIIYYRIISEREVCIPFDSTQYTREGAIKRYLNLSKDFVELVLQFKNGDIRWRTLYPTAEDKRKMAEAKRRKNFERLMKR